MSRSCNFCRKKLIYIPQLSVITSKKKVLVYFCSGIYKTAKDGYSHKPTLFKFEHFTSPLIERGLSVMVKEYIKRGTYTEDKDASYITQAPPSKELDNW